MLHFFFLSLEKNYICANSSDFMQKFMVGCYNEGFIILLISLIMIYAFARLFVSSIMNNDIDE